MWTFIKVALAAIAVGFITHKLNKKNLALGFIGSMLTVILYLLFQIPCDETRDARYYTEYFDTQYAVLLPCEHLHEISDIYHCNNLESTTVYTTLGELMATDEFGINGIWYCTECHNAEEAREYYRSNKNSDDAFLN